MALRAAFVTLGCARNEVDSEELAGALVADGWEVVDDPANSDAVLVNTCAFVAAAKKDSIDAILAVGDRPVIAVGCLAERYGATLAAELPEATVLSFDDYPEVGARLRGVLAGNIHQAHEPRDRRNLIPIAPVDRRDVPLPPGHAATGRVLTSGPSANLKLASGCDRRCSFCAIPMFRGAFVSRRPVDILAQANELALSGARELVLVSENSTSYGKDLGDQRLLESLLTELVEVAGIGRVVVSYLQPAELRDTLLRVLLTTPGVAPYLELSFQHASPTVLRRMRRFGDAEAFLALIARAREISPDVGVRSNFIVGFPGETDAEFAELVDFLGAARLDAIGIFGYSAEDGTEAADLPGALPEHVIRERVEYLAPLADELITQRAEDRIGSIVDVLVERIVDGVPEGRAGHQGPEDASTTLDVGEIGHFVRAEVIDSDGGDLIARGVGGGRS